MSCHEIPSADQIRAEIMELCLQKTSLTDFLYESGSRLHCTLAVFNSFGNLISACYPVLSAASQQDGIKRTIADLSASWLRFECSDSKIHQHCFSGRETALVSNIICKGSRRGFIAAFNCEDSDFSRQVLASVSLCMEFYFEPFFTNVYDSRLAEESILRQLISGATHDSYLYTQAIFYGLDKYDAYYTTVYIFRGLAQQKDSLLASLKEQHLGTVLAQKSYLFEYDNIFVNVIPFMYDEYSSIHIDGSPVVEQYDVLCGISNIAYKLSDLPRSYREACSAALLNQLLEKPDKLAHYSRVGFEEMLMDFEKNGPIEQYIHPAVNILKQYDREHKTTFYNTFCAYLENSLSIKKTCDCLYIHRNTLLYQLERIKDIAKLDFSNNDKNFYLACSTRIARYMEQSNHPLFSVPL